MRILRLRLRNLNSLRGDFSLDFTQPPFAYSGIFAITGDTGAGKTTLLDAITLALFGKTSRNHDREVMSYGAAEASAEVDFMTAEGVFRTKWAISRGKKGDLKTPYREIARQGEGSDFEILSSKKTELDGTKEEKGLVERFSGLNFEQFRRSVMLAQGEFAAFLKATESERAAILERLTDTEIYSRLSKAAFEKSKLENQQLADFQRERQLLRLLEPEEVAALKTQKTATEQGAAQLEAALKNLREHLAWLQNVAALEQKMAALGQTSARLADDRASLSPTFARLEQHRLTAPFSAQVARLQGFTTQKDEAEKAAERFSAQISTQAQAASVLEIALATAKEDLKSAEAEFRALENTLEKVVRLDEQAAAQRAAQEKLAGEARDLEAKIADWQRQKAAAETALAEAEAQFSAANEWLAAHEQAGHLAADLPLAQELLEQIRNLYRDQKPATEKRAQGIEQRGALTKQQAALVEKTTQASSQLAAQLADLQALFAENHLPSDNDEAAAAALHQRAETLGATLARLEEFCRHYEQYRQAVRDLDGVKSEQANLLVEDFALGKELLTALDLLDELEVKTALKRQRFEREMQAANYDRDRATLLDGAPCPLCGSTEHPFREHGVAVFVDDARAEFEAVQKQLAAVRATQEGLAVRHLQIQERLGAIEEDFEEATNEQARRLLAKIMVQEEAIGLIYNELEPIWSAASPAPFEEILPKKLAETRQDFARLSAAREQANGLFRQIRASERQMFEAENEQRQQEFLSKKTDAEISEQEQKLAELSKQIAGQTQRLDAVLAKHGLVFSPTPQFREQLAELEAQRRLFREHENARATAQEQVKLQGQTARERAEQLAERNEEWQEKHERLAQQQLDLEALRAERSAIFGDGDPARTRATQQADLKDKHQKINALSGEIAAARSLMSALDEQAKTNRTILFNLNEQISALRNDIENSLARSGFSSVDALLAAVLPEAEAAAIETQAGELRRRETEFDQSLRDTEQALAAARAQPFEPKPLDEAQRDLENMAAEHSAALQKIGGFRAQLAQNEALARESRELLTKIEAQKIEVGRWSRLRELIGSADGAAFRRFAQSLTLQQLVQHANRHLDKLNGRYKIRRRVGSDLDLEIVDTYQADNVRGMNTLSGGETFLASLALALGLSDLAGRKTRIQSLFIDEGFGALDENALELAITTLENLQASGTTIGIISHIRELKERIGTQIHVSKTGDGFSRMTLLG